MKNPFILIIMLTVLSCCSKDGNSSNEQLPPETQTGANTVGCLVNGKVFLPHAEGLSPDVNCFYQLIDGKYYFTMAFRDLRGGGITGVSIQWAGANLVVGQAFILSMNPVDNGDYLGGGGGYTLSLSNKYYTNTNQIGELKITNLDPSKSIISGTFWFNAINTGGQKVEIRQGRFDWKY